jgi:hypothetical protein
MLAGARLALGAGIEQVPPVPDSPRKAQLLEAVDRLQRAAAGAGEPGNLRAAPNSAAGAATGRSAP